MIEEDNIELLLFHLKTGLRLMYKLRSECESALEYALHEAQHDAESDEEHRVWESLIHMKIEPFDDYS